MLRLLTLIFFRIPLGGVIGVGVVLMLLAAIPGVLLGFVVGLARWSGTLGARLFDRAVVRLLY